MKTITGLYILLSLMFTTTDMFSQEMKGRYIVCTDYCYYDPCHGKFIFEFLDDKKCTMTWRDDVSYEISNGYYYVTDSSINFEPEIRPDSVIIHYIYDRLGNSNNSYNEYIQKDNENVVWLLERGGKRLVNNEVKIFRENSDVEILRTDNLGYAKYNGGVADSIGVSVLGRNFSLKPDKKNTPSWIKVYFDLRHKDMLDIINTLKYKDGKYWFRYKCDSTTFKESELRKLKDEKH
jgi:hypothetical protein